MSPSVEKHKHQKNSVIPLQTHFGKVFQKIGGRQFVLGVHFNFVSVKVSGCLFVCVLIFPKKTELIAVITVAIAFFYY